MLDNWLTSLLFQNRGMIEAAIVIGLFWAALSRPKRIRSPVMFRCAVIIFCLALVTPIMNQLVVFVLNDKPGGGVGGNQFRPGGGNNATMTMISLFLAAIPMLLIALSIYCAIDSIRPRAVDDDAAPTPAPKSESY